MPKIYLFLRFIMIEKKREKDTGRERERVKRDENKKSKEEKREKRTQVFAYQPSWVF